MIALQETAARLAYVIELHLQVERLVRNFDATVAACSQSLSFLDCRIVALVDRLGPVSLKLAAGVLGLPKTSVHYVLNKLHRAGYIQRSEGSRKGTPVFTATPAGREMLQQASLALYEAPFCRALRQLPDAELERVVAMLRGVWGTEDAQSRVFAEQAALGGAGLLEMLHHQGTGQPPPVPSDC